MTSLVDKIHILKIFALNSLSLPGKLTKNIMTHLLHRGVYIYFIFLSIGACKNVLWKENVLSTLIINKKALATDLMLQQTVYILQCFRLLPSKPSQSSMSTVLSAWITHSATWTAESKRLDYSVRSTRKLQNRSKERIVEHV